MKLLTFLCVILAIWKSEALPTNYESISKDTPDVLLDTMSQALICTREIGPNAERIQEMQQEGILQEDNSEFNSFFGCIWKKKRIIDDEGEVDRDHLRRYLFDLFTMGDNLDNMQNMLVDDVVDKCASVRGDDYGQTAVKVNNCVLNYLYKLVGDSD